MLNMKTKKIICYIFCMMLFCAKNINALENETGVTSIMSAAAENDVLGVDFFSKTLKNEINNKNVGGATALHIAARNGNVEIVKILLKYNIEVNVADNEGFTPLMRAIMANNSEIVKLLLDKKSDVFLRNAKEEDSFIIAANSGCTSCLEQIFNSIKPNIQSEDFQIELSIMYNIATKKNNEQMLKMLQSYIKLNNDKNVSANNNNAEQGAFVKNNVDEKKYIFNSENEEFKPVDNSYKAADIKVVAPLDNPSDKNLDKSFNNSKKFVLVKGDEANLNTKPQEEKNYKFVVKKDDVNEASQSNINKSKFKFVKGEEKKIIRNNVEELPKNKEPKAHKEKDETILFLNDENGANAEDEVIEKSKIIR